MDQLTYVLKRLFARRIVLISALLLLAVTALAVFFPMISSVDPNAIAVMDRLKAAPSAAHWAGTDELGRDLAMRIRAGGRYSIMIGIATAFFSVIAGTALGLLAASSVGSTH